MLSASSREVELGLNSVKMRDSIIAFAFSGVEKMSCGAPM